MMSGPKPKIVPQTGGGLSAIGKRITRLSQGVDPRSQVFRNAVQPVLEKLDKINEEDRMRGVDRHGQRLPPPKYRPKPDSRKTRRGSRNPQFGDAPMFGNLTKRAYLSLTGPRLAPRRLSSRIISNYVTGMEFKRGEWKVRAGWLDILDEKGRPFLQYHINGTSRLPKCDIGGLSKRAVRLLSVVAVDSFRENFL